MVTENRWVNDSVDYSVAIPPPSRGLRVDGSIISVHYPAVGVASARSDRRVPIVPARARAVAGSVFVSYRRTDTHADAYVDTNEHANCDANVYTPLERRHSVLQ